MFRELWFDGATRKYWWASAFLMLGYLPTIVFAMSKMESIQSPALRALVALSPMPFIAGLAYLEYLRIRRTDELRQRMELEAGMAGLVVSILVLTTLGLLDNAGLVRVPLMLAPPLMCVFYVCAQVWAHRHYR
ncbi:hypothetical protein [Dokdonella sp.]|uniref:hypothetical protein n=1 Tax=Dokdonella sp. TaxID=2291710 RepID=UPI00260D1A49|nr:hypothetical protein [Dokdonella sp.]